ncbi:hypothetical protein KXD40_004745 [Peronospora effusa]|nr:hypothetical protein KXD40_004738 [Peronospora effusa]UIZ27900.1 hypothetical protein KXD40_004739 [Peronospora effusa]UIZ28095.1 hypothetical protein KXD40_004740 [Peronospora effusa]UIZ28100.1 hypothetical protein KXD40_004745 [Peronospora effusa]
MLTSFSLFGLVAAVAVASCQSKLPDPKLAKYSLSIFGIGDWGNTPDDSSCCSGSHTNMDLHAQRTVAYLMNLRAQQWRSPDAVCGHGDNFYWVGINSLESRDPRFKVSFEDIYNGSSLLPVPWFNVMGNHDYGGANYICNSSDNLVRCNSSAEMLQGLDNKFSLQAEYVSPSNNRWNLKDQFYIEKLVDSVNDVSVDIFNIDTNDADVAGSVTVCCQCYGYAGNDSSGCGSIARGDKYCAGGDVAMYDACIARFSEWSDESRMKLAKEAAESKATWKMVNTHFGLPHYGKIGTEKMVNALNGTGAQIYIHGHTHGANVDYSPKLSTYFIENGVGGGQKKEPASGITDYMKDFVMNEWSYANDGYGFFSIDFSPYWAKVQFHSTGPDWVFTEKYADITFGNISTKFCMYIPVDGSEGIRC